MRIDLYTKVVLSIIAVCLLLLTAQSLRPKPVRAGREEIIKVNLVKVGEYWITKKEFLGIGKP